MNINRYMVESGSCWVYPLYAKDQDLFKLQSEAQTAERRLWRLPENGRVPPWEWRRR
ncbi:thermonuclease family protein [Marinobacter salexigens]|uniref:Thermonuclease family protein n=1 Tax=Marinobacter salexigens TaxID=1925763 RepID=A0ABS6A6N7_9GAMM|nr:thermonuclease family protein [Marinobacter salexigens]